MNKPSIRRVDLSGPDQKPGTPFLVSGSTRQDWFPAYSPDGKRIAFSSNRSGPLEIWVCNSDASNVMQLTSMGADAYAPKWSPDSRDIAFVALVGGNEDIYVVSANRGSPRRMTADPATDTWPSWSRDGQWIYFKSARSGTGEIWKMPAVGGDAVQITRNDGDRALESPDGKYLYYIKGDRYPEQCSAWKRPAAGGEATKVLDSVHCDGFWDIGGQGIYYFAKPDEKGRSEICLYEFANGKTREILALDLRYDYAGVAVSPDGRTILYSQSDQAGSDLMLVENFR
jgi:Tol biopolymer transport system component